jgi:hypothetical protein
VFVNNCLLVQEHIKTENNYHVCGTEFWLENRKGRDHLQTLSIDGRIILKYILNICYDVDRIELVQNMDQWRACVNTAMKHAFIKDGKFLTS